MVERQVCGNNCGFSPTTQGEVIKKQLRAFFVKGYIPKLIADDQIKLLKPVLKRSEQFLGAALTDLGQQPGYGRIEYLISLLTGF